MKKGMRVVAAVSAAALATIGLAACSSTPAGDGKVTIFGGYGQVQAAAFQKTLDAFGKANNIKITFTSLASFDTDIKAKIAAGQEPDIALWPQPGGLKDTASSLVPLKDVVDLKPIQDSLVPGWDKLATVDGDVYGLPVSANVKTLVFYNPEAFKTAGYTIPKTDAELKALEAKIVADGTGYPWCAGIESGGATGWAFTDWVEQYMLDLYPDKYADWVAGKVHFAGPEVSKAVEAVSARLLAPGQVNGGGAAMATDGFGDTAPLFETGGKAKGQCFMLRQGSFITDFFPDAIKAEVNAGNYTHANVFPLPAADGGQAGVLGGGDLAAVFDGHVDSDVAKVAAFIFSKEVGKDMAANGSFTSPHKAFDNSWYPNELTQTIGKTMADAAVFGFDGSDQMPSAVNAEFWASGTSYVAGKVDWATAAAAIDSKYNG